MSKAIRNKFFYIGLATIAVLVLAFFILPTFLSSTFALNSKTNLASAILATSTTSSATVTAPSPTSSSTIPAAVKKVTTHVRTPEAVKGIYMTACVAGTPSFRAKLLKLANETEINTIVIDVKDYTGTVSFPTDNPEFANNAGGGCRAKDMAAFIETLHQNNIYVVARITSFQDPYLAKLHPDWSVKKRTDKTVNWKDHKGIGYVDAGNKDVWKYLADLSKESYALGFDEINFDYIRFPSDGDMKDIYFPSSNAILVANATSTVSGKSKVMKSFFEYLHQTLSVEAGIPISADLFGMTATNYDDLNIGQVMEDAAPNFDFIDQMVYPSHYPVGFMNYMSVAAINSHPYEIVKFSMDSAVRRVKALITPSIKTIKTLASTTASSTVTSVTVPAKYNKVAVLRPWLQDNDYPVPYTPAMVRAQIQASYDAGLTSWLLWDAGNTYTQSALKPNEIAGQ